MKVDDLLDFVCKVAWTALIGACAAYAAVAFVRFLKSEPRPAVPERIEVVIVGQDKETPKPTIPKNSFIILVLGGIIGIQPYILLSTRFIIGTTVTTIPNGQ